MKFNYQATILIGTVALASNFNAGPANAIDCKTISVPWSWQVTKTGVSNISLDIKNTGPAFSKKPDSKTLTGAYIVKLLFDEPSNYCEKRGNAPTQTSLEITGLFTGLLASNFTPVPLVPGAQGPWAGASASVNILDAFRNETLPIGQQEINQTKTKLIPVGDGKRIPFVGNLDVFAYYGIGLGLGGPLGGSSEASAHLDVSAKFFGPTRGTVVYTVPTPEPLTMLASATAVGFGAFFKRQNSKNPKKS